MAGEKKPVHKVQLTDGKSNIIQQLLQEYDIQSAEDIQDTLRNLLGGTIKEMMETEMNENMSYEKSERSDTDDYRYLKIIHTVKVILLFLIYFIAFLVFIIYNYRCNILFF